jgi:hypothetical protein
MASSEMPSEHLAAPAAFEANDMIMVNRSADRHGRGSLLVGFCRWFTESRERRMDGRNKRRELVGRNLVLPNIRSNNVGCESSTKWRFFGHVNLRGAPDKNTMRYKSRRRF